MAVFPEVSTAVSSSILPKKVEVKMRGSTVHLPEDMWDQLDAIATESKVDDPAGGYSRNEVITLFLRWAIREHEAEQRARKAGKRKAE